MSGQARLKLIIPDPETGEVPEHGCPDCQRWEMDYQLLLKEKAEQERKHLREKNRWKQDREKQRQEYARRADVEHLWSVYQRLWGKHRSKLSGDRFDMIAQALDWGYTVAQVELAMEGHRARPYWGANYAWSATGTNRLEKLSTVLKSGERIEEFAVIGAQERKARA